MYYNFPEESLERFKSPSRMTYDCVKCVIKTGPVYKLYRIAYWGNARLPHKKKTLQPTPIYYHYFGYTAAALEAGDRKEMTWRSFEQGSLTHSR